MKTKSILTLAAVLLASAGFTLAQTTEIGRCGEPRGTCGHECDGSGFQNQGRGQGKGFGHGKRDGNGNGNGEQKRERRRDGSGDGCKKAA